MSEKKMSRSDLKHLFTPGTGAVPPYLAGRKQEQAYFRDCVDVLKGRNSVSRDLILYGPRGNGKTALLRYLEAKTRQKEASKLDILRVTPDELRTLDALSGRLMDGHQTVRKRFKSVEVSGGVGGLFQAKTEVDLSLASVTIRKLLQERSGNKPFILIIDEAHRLTSAIAESLLNASQTVRLEGCPFLLVLAGTPNLEAALGKANASFWDRSKILPLGRLSSDEAGAALTVPLQEAGITFAPGAVEEIVTRAHCYPFFIQVWGDCLARRLDETKETQITLAQVKEVEDAVINERNGMYQVRRNEIKKMRLLPVAERVADAFIQCEEPVLHESTLEEAIESGLAGDEPVMNGGVMEKFEQLSHLGYIWQVRGAYYEPGIQSLMSFIQEYSLSQIRGKEAEPHTTSR